MTKNSLLKKSAEAEELQGKVASRLVILDQSMLG